MNNYFLKTFLDSNIKELFKMIVVNETWEKGYTQDQNENLCVAYKDDKGELVAMFPLYMEDDLVEKIDKLAQTPMPNKMPGSVYQLEEILRHLYDNMVMSYIYKETAEFASENGIFDKELGEKVLAYATDVHDKCNAELEAWAELHPLWMGHTFRGNEYGGENPYNMYPSEAYSTPDMYNLIWPYRNNIRSIAFGRSSFDVTEMCNGLVGKEYLQREKSRRSNSNER
jgi:hypothetical protein